MIGPWGPLGRGLKIFRGEGTHFVNRTATFCFCLSVTTCSPILRGETGARFDGKLFKYRGPPGSAGPPNVNLGPPNISKSTTARMLKLKTQLDIVKYSLWLQKFLR